MARFFDGLPRASLLLVTMKGVLRLNSDDIYFPNALEIVNNYFIENEKNSIVSI